MVEEAKEGLIKVMAVAVMDSFNGKVSIYMTCFCHSAFFFSNRRFCRLSRQNIYIYMHIYIYKKSP